MASTIEWTDETWNPVTGCSRVSPGCDNCYMFSLYPRLRGMKVPGYDETPEVVQIFPERLDLPLRWKKPRRIFVNSMADLFHPAVPADFITDAFVVMERTGREAWAHVPSVDETSWHSGSLVGLRTLTSSTEHGPPPSGSALQSKTKSMHLASLSSAAFQQISDSSLLNPF